MQECVSLWRIDAMPYQQNTSCTVCDITTLDNKQCRGDVINLNECILSLKSLFPYLAFEIILLKNEHQTCLT